MMSRLPSTLFSGAVFLDRNCVAAKRTERWQLLPRFELTPPQCARMVAGRDAGRLVIKATTTATAPPRTGLVRRGRRPYQPLRGHCPRQLNDVARTRVP